MGVSTRVLVFLLVKLRFYHRRILETSVLSAKLFAVYRTTALQIALHYDADAAAQFIVLERASFLFLGDISAATVLAELPLKLFAGDATIADQFAATTASPTSPSHPAALPPPPAHRHRRRHCACSEEVSN
jgi:hypothetical protein